MRHAPDDPGTASEGFARTPAHDAAAHRDPAQVLELIRDVLRRAMDARDHAPGYRVARIELIGRETGRPISSVDIADGVDTPSALRLHMRDGAEYLLRLEEG